MYFCKSQERRLKVTSSTTINGIDFLEVSTVDQKFLEVHFLHPLPGQAGGIPNGPGLDLQLENIQISGGVRIKNIDIVAIIPNGNVLTIEVSEAGDFSYYTFRLVTSPTDGGTPTGFDPRLAELSFSFKANCPSDFDCKTNQACPPDVKSDPRIDYFAKDYASFKRIMLDRMSLLMPEWIERNPADLQIALVEMLAFTGDYLSYYQDAVATESYVFKARLRTSIRRHARLLDYHVHNGCNARVWIHVGLSVSTLVLPERTKFLTRGNSTGIQIHSNDFSKTLREHNVLVYESMQETILHAIHNEIKFYTWDDLECCIPEGATQATLYIDGIVALQLKTGDVLLFEEVLSPTTGLSADADLSHRWAVRLTAVTNTTDVLNGNVITEITWHDEDALPFALCISQRIKGVLVNDISVARGNAVLADHGLTVPYDTDDIILPAAPESGLYRPYLPDKGITVLTGYVYDKDHLISATQTLRQNPAEAIPYIRLIDGQDTWYAVRDLLGSDRFQQEFVAEVESDLSVCLRFGDDYLGEKPGEGFQPKAIYRIGNGIIGNVGPEAIGKIVFDTNDFTNIRNPMPAISGVNQETIEEVKQFAPEAFRVQERAVTESDYVEKTKQHADVQNAMAQFRWTGSWHTVFLMVDRKGGKDVDETFKDELRDHLEKYRLAGYDLEILPPIYVPMEIEMQVCVAGGHFRSAVEGKLVSVFSRNEFPDGQKGFFHPDNFTFGQPLYVSTLIDSAMQVDGVSSVEIRTFKRMNRSSDASLANQRFKPAQNEIIQLDNDPNFPENGKLQFSMLGGL